MRWWLPIALAACVTAAPPPPAHPASPSALVQLEATPDLDGATVGHTDAHATIVIAFASWCPHCHDELAILDRLRAAHPHLRILGLNYKGHEEYDHLGGAQEVRRYRAEHAPWLRVVPVDDAIYVAFGSPSKIPTMYVYDAHGALIQTFDRAVREQPGERELEALLARLGA